MVVRGGVLGTSVPRPVLDGVAGVFSVMVDGQELLEIEHEHEREPNQI